MTPPPVGKPKFITYYWVSTERQGRSGLGLEAQKEAVRSYLDSHGGRELATFTEVESGKHSDRPQLRAAVLRCKQSHATLLVAKLDRLSRNAAFLMSLRDASVKFEALDIPGANTLTIGVMALLAQQERELISSRTRDALAARRRRGLPLGTPRDLRAFAKRAGAKGREVSRAKAIARAKEIAPQLEEARAHGRNSLRAIAAYLNEQEITTPRGKRWTATAVANAQQLLTSSTT